MRGRLATFLLANEAESGLRYITAHVFAPRGTRQIGLLRPTLVQATC
jgi:hypothetical protein